jgi:hypothetical protein
MGKKNKPQIPFKVNMVFSLDGLEGIPPDTIAPQIFMNWVIKSVILYSQQSKGLMIQNHRQAKRLREIFEQEVKTFGVTQKQKVLEELRENMKLEGLDLGDVKTLIDLLCKAGKDVLLPNSDQFAKEALQQITEAEAKDAHAEVELEQEDWKFMMQCWRESKKPMEANEVIVRIDDNLRQAQSDHDREMNEDEPPKKEESDDKEKEGQKEEKEVSDEKAEPEKEPNDQKEATQQEG